MKKYLILLLLLIPALAFVSCSDDDKDLPNVDFDFTFENATVVDGTVYVVRGQTMEITAINVVNKEPDKSAIITVANYYWDRYFIGSTAQPPFAFEIEVSDQTPLGKHLLDIQAPLYAVDKAPAVAVVGFNVEVVESADDIPEAAAPTTRISPSISSTAD